MPRRAGRKDVRVTLDRRTFRFTGSQLERRFIALALSAGLPTPETCGTTQLRFAHSQIKYEPGYVRAMLATVARRLAREQVGRQLEQVGHG